MGFLPPLRPALSSRNRAVALALSHTSHPFLNPALSGRLPASLRAVLSSLVACLQRHNVSASLDAADSAGRDAVGVLRAVTRAAAGSAATTPPPLPSPPSPLLPHPAAPLIPSPPLPGEGCGSGRSGSAETVGSAEADESDSDWDDWDEDEDESAEAGLVLMEVGLFLRLIALRGGRTHFYAGTKPTRAGDAAGNAAEGVSVEEIGDSLLEALEGWLRVAPWSEAALLLTALRARPGAAFT